MARGRSSKVVFGAALLGAAWQFASSSAFVGGPSSGRSAATQAQGYRFDWMLEKKDGTGDLQTQDGYFLGERGFEKSQNAQGLRYRLRPSPKEFAEGTEVEGLLYQFGPIKVKLGEAFGGTGNNPKLRELKKKLADAGLNDPKKLAENDYWQKRYGHKRWSAKYVDQSQGNQKGFLRGLAAWSGLDPLKEERGVTWFEADYGKPWLKKYKGRHVDGVSKEQIEREYNAGILDAPKIKSFSELPPVPPPKV